ncbi:MAG: putative nicotinamide N-methyase [Cellvibrionaceae bacterium]|jgi:predicted nicotinamide N-methyase
MIDYLNVHPPKKRWRILDVGCGWGISGIYCAKNFAAKVTGLDADDTAFAFLDFHAELNGVKVITLKSRFEKMTVARLADYDMIIGSDICFWDEVTNALYHMINRARRLGIKRVVIADPGRSPFRQMAEKYQEKHEVVYDNWSFPHPINISGLVLDVRF